MHSTVTSLAQRRGVRQFIKFAVVGASGMVVSLVVYGVLGWLVPSHRTSAVEDEIIFAIGFLAGGVSNYFFNRIWTFRSTGHAVQEGAKFLTVSTVACLVALLAKGMLGPSLGRGLVTWFIATVAGTIINFFLNKYWTFKHVN